MNEVFKLLKGHHERTGEVMSPEQFAKTLPKGVTPIDIAGAVIKFDRYLDRQRERVV